jgi:flagellar export protein FliJ
MAFKFRAQAALDLRTRELEAAQRDLARAEADRDLARQRVGEATRAVAAARVTAATAQQTATDCTALQWYRFWILRLDHERKALETTLTAREEAVRQATAACLRARQRRESLARFRDKAQLAYEAAEAAAERKLIDELATRRYAATRQSASQAESSTGIDEEHPWQSTGSDRPATSRRISHRFR